MKKILSYVLIISLVLSANFTVFAKAAEGDSGKITVSFTLLGDKVHADSGERHSYAEGNLTPWITKQNIEIDEDATILEVFEKALTANNITWDAAVSEWGTYINSITKESVTLAGGTNGAMSGWLYLLNEASPALGVDTQTVQNGDDIVFHYTDDFNYERVPKTPLINVLKYIRTKVQSPSVGSVGGEWAVIALNRGGQKDYDWNQGYLYQLKRYLDNKNNTVKITDYERMILALTSMGVNATMFSGHNLFADLLKKDSSGEYDVKKQGLNGVAYALLAVDCGNYLKNDQGNALRNWCIDYLLAHARTDGGWNFAGEMTGDTDPDITGMILQSLAPYYKNEKSHKHSEVKSAAEKAVTALQEIQKEDGGFGFGNGESSSDSTSMVARALIALDYDKIDYGFFLDGVISSLLTYQDENSGGFKFSAADAAANQMSSESAAQALAAYERYMENKTFIYDMSDLNLIFFTETTIPSNQNKTKGKPAKLKTLVLKKLSPKKITLKTKKIKVKVTKGAKLTFSVKGIKKKTGTAKKTSYTFKKLNLKKAEKGNRIVIKATKRGYKAKSIRLKIKRS